MQKPKDTSESESAETSGGVTRRLRVQAKPILYKNDSEPVPRDVLYEFLTTCSKMLLAKDNILEIIEDSIQRRIGLQVSAIEFQRDVLENNFQIERNYGCQHLSQMQLNYENDVELLEAGKNFMYCAMRSYLDGLKLRKEIHYKQVIKVPLNRVQILEFFEGCNSLSKYFLILIIHRVLAFTKNDGSDNERDERRIASEVPIYWTTSQRIDD